MARVSTTVRSGACFFEPSEASTARRESTTRFGEPVDLVGHDWGAGLTYRVVTAHGGRPSRTVEDGVEIAWAEHPSRKLKTLRTWVKPKQDFHQ